MNQFKIIPVIDLLNSRAVHAVKGNRSEYKPLESKYFNTTSPYDIIESLHKKFGFKDFYIADLDSIMKKKTNIPLISELLKNLPINIMLDPGITNDLDLKHYSGLKISQIILGMETIKSLNVIENAINIFGYDKTILSIDMFDGKIISSIKELRNLNLIEIMKKVENMGIINYILLDLYRVGQKIGEIPNTYLKIRENYDGNFFVGGGIKDFKEIVKYKIKKFAGVLIATSLYDGTINLEKIKSLYRP